MSSSAINKTSAGALEQLIHVLLRVLVGHLQIVKLFLQVGDLGFGVR